MTAKDDQKRSDEYSDALNQFGDAFSNLGRILGEQLLEAGKRVSEEFDKLKAQYEEEKAKAEANAPTCTARGDRLMTPIHQNQDHARRDVDTRLECVFKTGHKGDHYCVCGVYWNDPPMPSTSGNTETGTPNAGL